MWFLWLIGCRISGVCTAQQPAAFLHLQAPACRGGQGKRKAKQGMLISELILLLTSLQLSKHAHTCTGWDSTEEAVVVRKPCELSHTVFLSEQEPVTHSCPYPEWQDWVTDFIIMNSRELTAGCCPSLQLHSYYRPQVQTIVIKRKQRQFINRVRKSSVFLVLLQCTTGEGLLSTTRCQYKMNYSNNILYVFRSK